MAGGDRNLFVRQGGSSQKSLGNTGLDHNFWTRNPSKSSKVSKDSAKTSAKYYHLTVGAQGQAKWVKVA